MGPNTGGYQLLTPAHRPPRELTHLHHDGCTPEELANVLEYLGPTPVAVDLETTGLDPTDPDGRIVGVGLAGAAGTFYLDTRDWDKADQRWDALVSHLTTVSVVGFNAPFDGAWLWGYRARHLNWLGCGHVLFRLLANEGHPGQRWSLAQAVTTLLGWASHKDPLEVLLAKHNIASKDDMCKLAALEPEAFARYCAMDAEAHWQLWHYLVAEATRCGYQAAVDMATTEWVSMIELLIEQQHHGVCIDVPRLTAYRTQLQHDIAKAEGVCRAHPQLAPHIQEWETKLALEHYTVRVSTKRTKATRADTPAPNADWYWLPSTAKSLTKAQAAEGGYWYRETTEVTVPKAATPRPRANFQSDPFMRWLLYERCYPNPKLGGGKAQVRLSPEFVVEVRLTETGQLPVGKEVLPALGEVGRAITQLNQLNTRLSYVEAYLAASARDGRIHAAYKAPGTLTARLGGGS